MKKNILITGANSYLGTSFESYIKENYSSEYNISTLDLHNKSWESTDFSLYDSIFHVSGIAHSDTKKADSEIDNLYKRVNTDLAFDVAKKAKADGVGQFIFMSSAIVYGSSGSIGQQKRINASTTENPENCYGASKLNAESKILPLVDENYKVVIIRSPMVYGKNCKGNYVKLSKFAQKMPLFPKVENERSMIYIGNLVEFVRLMIKNEENGIFFPQNAEYSNTSEIIKKIATAHGKKIHLAKGFVTLLKLAGKTSAIVDKVFGNLSYDMTLSEYKENYRKYTLDESIILTELE